MTQRRDRIEPTPLPDDDRGPARDWARSALVELAKRRHPATPKDPT